MKTSFFKDDRGSVALIIGVALVLVLIGILSLTIDLNRTQTSYSNGQGATDAAALSTAEFILKGITNQVGISERPFDWRPSDDELKDFAKKAFLSNFETDQTSAVLDQDSFEVTYTSQKIGVDSARDYKVTVKACANLKTDIAKAANHAESTRTCTTSNAGFSLTSLDNVEVAFALDFTNSMYMQGQTTDQFPPFAETKAAKMVEAMNYVFDNYFPAINSVNSDVYGSVIPFTGQVNLYPYNELMVERNTTPPVLESSTSYFADNFINYSGPDRRTATESNFYAHYPAQYSYVLDRIPAFDETKFNSLLSSADPSSQLPFKSFRHAFDNLPNPYDDNRNFEQDKMHCYNRAVGSALDQRAEKEMGIIGTNGIITQPDTRILRYLSINRANGQNCGNVPVPADMQAPNCTRRACSDGSGSTPGDGYLILECGLHASNGGRINELHQAFPVQPLTNNVQILKNIVNGYTSNTTADRLFSNAGVAESTITDLQGSRLNKASMINARFGTSSIHGLLWSWLTINNNLNGNWWNQKSIYENHDATLGSNSQASRANLPSNNNKKYIILITDGNDNDGAGNTINGTTYRNTCDAYEPRAKFDDDKYVGLCSRIKNENVKIYTILYDFNPPAGRNKYQECASANGYHANVTPDQLKGIMDDVFRSIILDLARVSIVK